MTAYKKIPILFERRIGIFLISNPPLWDEIKSNPLSEKASILYLINFSMFEFDLQ